MTGAYLLGVSTRKVDDLVKASGADTRDLLGWLTRAL
jgi:hypothetical protein